MQRKYIHTYIHLIIIININCRLFFKQNSLTLFHCSLMFKAKCEYWARFTISYVDFDTYIISREVTLKSTEPDGGIRGRWALIEDCAQLAHLGSQVTVFSVCRWLPCGGYDQAAQAGLGLYRVQQ